MPHLSGSLGTSEHRRLAVLSVSGLSLPRLVFVRDRSACGGDEADSDTVAEISWNSLGLTRAPAARAVGAPPAPCARSAGTIRPARQDARRHYSRRSACVARRNFPQDRNARLAVQV